LPGGISTHRVPSKGFRECFLPSQAFLAHEILGREPAPEELAGWRTALVPAPPHRRALAAALFDARRALCATPGDTLAADRLRLP
jgi:hypothetical protein